MRRTRSSIVLRLLMLAFAMAAVQACGSDDGASSGVATDRQAPAAPSGLKVDKIRDGEIWLSWDAATDDSDSPPSYRVYRRIGTAGSISVDSTAHTTFQDFGLEYETEYTYYITAVDAAGNESPPSRSVSGQPFNNLAPLAPTGLRAFAHNLALLAQQTVDISLDWDANMETDLQGYRIYRGTAAGFAIGAGSLRAETQSPRFVDEEVAVGSPYFYKVTAVDRGGKESPVSPEVSDTPLHQAILLEPLAGALVAAPPAFRWSPVAGALTYQVIVTTSPASGEISSLALTADTTAVFRGRAVSDHDSYVLESGQVYYWKVIASTRVNGQENSVSSVESFKVQ